MKRKLRFLCEMKGRPGLLASVFAIILFSTNAWAQSREVSGTVTASEDNTTLPGASILIKGTATGTTTDADGRFTLTVPDNATVLQISSIGYLTREITVGTQTEINVALMADVQSLSEIVVVGYGTQKRKDVTGAISSVSSTLIEKVPVSSVDQSLQGRAAGVQITNNDASPGGNASVLVRGIGSLASGGNAPLYVVDGYPTTEGINNINPNDIASIDVLKDASATAIYGVRAANGVVVITTKKGFKDKIQVSIDAYTAFQSKPKPYDILNARDWATLSNYVEANDASGTYKGLPLWHTPDALTTVDWQDAMYRQGVTQNYSLAIRGGTDKVQTAVSFGHYNQKGIVLGSYFKRYTVGLNLDYQAAKWLKSSTNIKYTNQDASNPFGTGQLFNLVINPPTLDGGNSFTNQIKDGNGNYGFYNPLQANVFKFNNPVYTVETNQYENKNHYVLATSSLEAEIFDGLKLKTNAGINLTSFSGSFLQPQDTRANAQYPSAAITQANYHQNMRTAFEWLWENTLSYDKTFDKHTLNFIAGVSAQETTTTLMGAGGIPPNNTTRDLAQVSNLQFDQYGNGRSIATLASTFARLTYQYNDKYMITGTIRRDGSSKFGPKNKYGTFPSAAVGWRIKNEDFLKDVGFLDDLKLRGSWGRVGNQIPISLFQYQAWYVGNYAASYNGGGKDNFGYPFNKLYQNGTGLVQLANPDLKWETDEQTDIGVDAAFLNGRLTFSADWFTRDSKDFLLTLAAPAQTGVNFMTRNVGSMNNKGIELALGYNGNLSSDFHFGANLTLTHIKNTLTSLTSGTDFVSNFGSGSQPVPGLASNTGATSGTVTLTGQGWDEFSRSYVGRSVGEFFGYKSLGIIQSQAQIDALNAAAPGGIYYRAATKPGDRYFADINGDGKVDATDRVSIGSPMPKFFGGLNLDGTYKAFDFNLYFYGSFGNKILNYVESNLQTFQKRGSEGVENVSVDYYNNYWTPDRPSDKYTRPLANDDNTLNSVPSDVWVENGSFVKLKAATIGYTVPSTLLTRAAITKLRVYVSSQNLFFITKYTGLDPEVGIQGGNATQNGVDNGTYPSTRTFTVGLNVTF
jgi:TonB-dependent starch-binding outer membrane protein SusC